MSLPLPLYRGYVNTWECDEMGHMNVQFYMAKLEEALLNLRAALGLPAHGPSSAPALRTSVNHVRFLAEQRSSDLVAIRGGVARADETGLTIFSEMSNPGTNRVAATFTSRLTPWDRERSAPTAVPAGVLARARDFACEIPEYGAPRGVPAEPALQGFGLEEAPALGLVEIYRGAVMPAHCDVYGWNALQYYAGRISDGAPHLWTSMGLDRQKMLEIGRGVAVLEFSWRHGEPLGAGRTIVALSGLRDVGRKTVTIRHCLFDGESGAPVGVSEAVAVTLDLRARRAAEMNETERALFAAGKIQWPDDEASTSS